MRANRYKWSGYIQQVYSINWEWKAIDWNV